ncbi:IS3 family transposase [Paenibacillus sp. V4I7]|uniref:IS3 family transposase n=1 Tax=Paenibacillus sp. V4I7 TaxID=3042307 RepID=UPI003593A1D7
MSVSFGYRQLTLHMRKQTGKVINHKRVYRLMKVKGIQSVIRRKKKKYAHSTPQQVADNLLNRKFQAAVSTWFPQFMSWCPDCMKMGYHSWLHQFALVHNCPIHQTNLINACPSILRGVLKISFS